MEFVAHPIRLRIIAELRRESEQSATAIAKNAGLDPDIVTLHLHLMEDKQLIAHHFGAPTSGVPEKWEPVYLLTPKIEEEIRSIKQTVAALDKYSPEC